MELHEIKTELESIYNKLVEDQGEFGELKAKYESLKEGREVKLAVCASRKNGSEAAVKRMALADEEYQSYLVDLSLARCNYLVALSKKNTIDAKISVLQTLGSNIRSEIGINKYQRGA